MGVAQQPLTRPPVVLALDRPRALKFDINAGAAIEEASGKSIGQLLARGALSLASMRWLVWGLLLHEDPSFVAGGAPTLTVADVGTLLQAHWFERGQRLGDLASAVSEAMNRSWVYGPPVEPEPDEGNAPPEGESGDSTSSPSGTGC